jgi:5-(carboxyamino)imidazole ribonucleotide synthase
MTTLAILGGGQLGWMLGLAAKTLGVDTRFLDPSKGVTASAVGEVTTASLDDAEAVINFAAGSDVVTYEWEGVPASTVEALINAGNTVHPGIASLSVSQDRLVEKKRLQALGIPVAPHAEVSDLDSLQRALRALGLPAILKSRRGGYDGKSQVLLRDEIECEAALATLANAGNLILEGFIPFEREVSIIAVRGVDGEIKTWPLVENLHREGILRLSRVSSEALQGSVKLPLEARAIQYVTSLLEDLDHVGVLTLELFVHGDQLIANEFAPRVHNSGHWSIEGSKTSQFENHVRAVTGLPLGETDLTGASAMVNCIGVMPNPDSIATISGAHLHDYAKSPRTGRKVGHITLVAPNDSDLDASLSALFDVLPGDDG